MIFINHLRIKYDALEEEQDSPLKKGRRQSEKQNSYFSDDMGSIASEHQLQEYKGLIPEQFALKYKYKF